MNTNITQEIKNLTGYGMIEGRTIIHSMSCIYIRNTKRNVIPVDKGTVDSSDCLCGKCLKSKDLKWTADIEENGYSVVLDLEMCKVSSVKRKTFHNKMEIIQIGAVLLNKKFEIVSEFSTFVKPEYGSIDYFISNLTGITDTQIKSAPALADALRLLLNWIDGRADKIYAWSESDYKQLTFEIGQKELLTDTNQALLDMEWIDYQDVFGKRYEMNRQVALEEALLLAEITAEGRLHDGLDDSINTAHLIEKLENNPDYQLVEGLAFAREEKKETLQYTLGEKFGNVFSQILAAAN